MSFLNEITIYKVLIINYLHYYLSLIIHNNYSFIKFSNFDNYSDPYQCL